MDIANKANVNGVISRDDLDRYYIEECLSPSEAVALEKKFSVESFSIDLTEDPVWVDLTSIKVYLTDMRRLLKEKPPLSADEERELSYLVLNSEDRFTKIQARNVLVERNLPFAFWMAKKFEHRVTSSVGFEDLIQTCNQGLVEAAEVYDGTKGTRFTTYAYWWLLSSVHRCLVDKGYAVKIPARYPARFNHLKTAEDIVLERLKGVAPIEEVVKEHNRLFPTDTLSVPLAKEILTLYPSAVSLEEPLFDDGEEKTRKDFIRTDDVPTIEEDTEISIRKEVLLQLIDTVLTENEKTVIKARYNLDNDVEEKQRVIAERMGVKPQRVQQLQKRAEEKLYQAMKKINFNEMLML